MAIAPLTVGFNLKYRPATPPLMTSTSSVKTNVAAISIFASAAMAIAKFAVGVAIGSLALISEALHSSVDVVATVITWLVVRVSDAPADEEHH
jgi:divalent metal cation (Fe/Co/Zn/Cd) transporter